VSKVECVILIDFDGTIVTIDTAEYVLDKFAGKDWRIIDEQLERGEITFEESLVREFAMLKVSEKQMLDALEPATHFRPNFEKMIEYCRMHSFPLVVVSGGLDFSIRHFLGQKGWLDSVEIFAPRAECTDNGVILSFPKRFDQMSTNFKEDLVRYYRIQRKKVVYIGNGLSDYPAAKIADVPFAVRGSKLAQLCRNARIACEEITDFQQAVELIKDWLTLVEKKA
jgi:2,3-diketo-5-methylthio-1-phosphopentane phosphatase